MSASDDLLWQRWDEVDQLLDEVLDQPAEGRASFLAQRAGADAALLALVQRLLARLGGESGRLTGPSHSMLRGAFSGDVDRHTESDLEAGTAVDRYVIVARRGRGGMATVYEARRSDGTFDQRVALKVLRRGLDTDDLIARFVNERQILSSLAHHNIARLLDGGSLGDGRPYLVMELVDGEPITTFADDRRLGTAERLDLFVAVAGAVHAAHRQLVVHRDIKPSNILVDADGQVKLLDFGIAKLLEGDAGHTSPGERMLTPDYASPEQVRGDPITTGTDIYQLGLLLRELLTGLRPLAGDTNPGEPPVHPSRAARLSLPGAKPPEARAEARATTPSRLAETLQGDLDIIVGKALRPSPDERFSSAEEMAADVRRYLQGRPILAHPESTPYLIRKFIARNPLFVPAALAATVAVVGFVTALALQNRRIGRERDAAELASRRAIATESFLVDILRSPDPTNVADRGASDSLTVIEALQRGRLRIEEELTKEPDVRASLLAAIGRTYTGLGRYEVADTILRTALAIQENVYGPTDLRTLATRSLIGRAYRESRRMADADSVFHEALRTGAAGELPDTVLTALLDYTSSTRLALDDADSARALASRGVRILRARGDTLGTPYLQALSSLAPALRGVKQLDSAEAVYGIILRRQQSQTPPNRYAIAVTYNNLGFLQRTREDFPAAERSYREARRIATEVLGPGHPTTLLTTTNLQAVLEFMGKLDAVAEVRREEVAATLAQWPNGHWRVGAAQVGLGRFFLRHDRFADAVAPMQEGLATYTRTLGPGHAWTLVAQAQLGLALVGAGRVTDGEGQLDRAIRGIRALPEPPNAELLGILGQLGGSLRAVGATRAASRVEQLRAPT